MTARNIALATVVTEDFLLGAQVMIASFLRHNHWFDGEIIVFHRDLAETSQKKLCRLSGRVSIRTIGSALVQRMDAVSAAAGWNDNKAMQFASFETFALEGFERVIFCDSDLLFLGSIGELLAGDAALVVCGDGAFFRGNARRLADFAEVSTGDGSDEDGVMRDTFNTGMMVVGKQLRQQSTYDCLVDMIRPEMWASDTTGHTDQMLLNMHFAGQQSLADIRFNYPLSHRDLITQATGITPGDAVVLHFTGPAKPWRTADALAALGMDRSYFEAYSIWRDVAAKIE